MKGGLVHMIPYCKPRITVITKNDVEKMKINAASYCNASPPDDKCVGLSADECRNNGSFECTYGGMCVSGPEAGCVASPATD